MEISDPLPGPLPGEREALPRSNNAIGVVLERRPAAGREASPRDAAAVAEAVDQLAAVVGNTRWQHVVLPGRGGELEALELLHHHREPFGAVHGVLCRRVLPVREETQEVGRGDRLDLGAQAGERVAMDAGKQPPVAPFDVGRAGREASAQDASLAFERERSMPASGTSSCVSRTGPSTSRRLASRSTGPSSLRSSASQRPPCFTARGPSCSISLSHPAASSASRM